MAIKKTSGFEFNVLTWTTKGAQIASVLNSKPVVLLLDAKHPATVLFLTNKSLSLIESIWRINSTYTTYIYH